MQFYSNYQKLLNELAGVLNERQKGYLYEMKDTFASLKESSDFDNDSLESLKKEKQNLKKSIESQNKKKEKVTKGLIVLRQEYERLKLQNQDLLEAQEKTEIGIDTLKSQLRSQLVKGGIVQSKYSKATDAISDIYEYVLSNRCQTKESLEASLKQKFKAAIKICPICNHSEASCKC